MAKKFKNVYQFKIVLNDIQPRIERVIQVPDTYSFWDLHVAIQDAMGWLDYHLHEFKMLDPRNQSEVFIGIPDDEFDTDYELFAGWDLLIRDFFTLANRQAQYDYDFGDGWQHTITLENIVESQPDIKYPLCISGQRACPPEDCGGVWGYENLLEVLANKDHEEHQSMKKWLGGRFDPEQFDSKKVKFDNPSKRWKMAFAQD